MAKQICKELFTSTVADKLINKRQFLNQNSRDLQALFKVHFLQPFCKINTKRKRTKNKKIVKMIISTRAYWKQEMKYNQKMDQFTQDNGFRTRDMVVDASFKMEILMKETLGTT